MGQSGLGDKGLIRRVKQDDRLLVQGVIHPGFQLFFVVRGASGVVGRAEVDNIRFPAGIGQRQKAVFLVGIDILDLPAGDDIGIHIHGIHRVGHQHGVVHIEQIHNIAYVALGAIAHEHFRRVHIHPEIFIISGDGFPQKGITVAVGGVAVECLFMGLFLSGFVHGFDHRRRQRHGHVADTHFDDAVLRMFLRISRDLLGDGHKQVALL